MNLFIRSFQFIQTFPICLPPINLGSFRHEILSPIASRPLMNTGSLRRVRDSRSMTRLCASSGVNVTNTGPPYLTRCAFVSKRIFRRTSCVPGCVFDTCSMLFSSLLAVCERTIFFTFVISPFTGILLPLTL